MKQFRNMKRPRLATIVAALALFIVVGGTATAASGLINGKKIKKGTVTAKQLKNKTITKAKLKPALISSLKGQAGPQGQQGPKGDKGEAGTAGANGVVSPVYEAFDSINLPANTELGMGTISLPAGKYMVTATATVVSNGTASMGCNMSAGAQSSESANWTSNGAGTRTTLPLQMITNGGATQVTVGCHPGTSGGAASGTIIATPVQ
jgi:hypothetical protein